MNENIKSEVKTTASAAPSATQAAGLTVAATEQSFVATVPSAVVGSAAEVRSTRGPNFMASRRVLPDLVEVAIEKQVKVTLTKAGYEVDGFYRLSPMRLEPDAKTGGLIAIDKKDVATPISTFDDLVRLNYECWKKSRDKGAAYITPGREWLEEFARLNLVKRQVIFVPGD